MAPSARLGHIETIASFAAGGWGDPIELDVGVPSLGFNPAWVICDGNHRFAAAIVLGHDTIAAHASGSVDEILLLCVDPVSTLRSFTTADPVPGIRFLGKSALSMRHNPAARSDPSMEDTK